MVDFPPLQFCGNPRPGIVLTGQYNLSRLSCNISPSPWAEYKWCSGYRHAGWLPMWAVIRPWRWLQESEICDVEIPGVPATACPAPWNRGGPGSARWSHGYPVGGSHDAMGL